MLEQISPRTLEFYSGKRSITDTFQQCKEKSCRLPNLPTCLPANFMEILTCAYCEVDQPELKDFANAFCKVDLNQNCDTSKLLTAYEEQSISVFTDEQDDQSVNISWTTSK